ncbi:MAG: preprotein translocase subunit SecG [Parcubacteria group bacterium SW_4_46_8]|nr:MAG: preprotein translocase subunit SecG [Parcubacteria group bacterium SW_4_46_8]
MQNALQYKIHFNAKQKGTGSISSIRANVYYIDETPVSQRPDIGCKTMPNCYNTAAMQALDTILPYIQIIISILLVAGILMQQSDASLGAVFGGGDDGGGAQRTRRGFEKILFNTTITLGVLFALTAFIALII